jgi:hypothetical protein
MGNAWYEGDSGDENDFIAPDDLSDIFLDDETIKIAARGEAYRKNYTAEGMHQGDKSE